MVVWVRARIARGVGHRRPTTDDQRRTSDHKGRIHRDISRSRIAVAVVRDVARARDDSGGRTRARGRRGVWV